MERALTRTGHEATGDDDLLVHEWRVERLTRLGIPRPLAQAAANRAGSHQVATLVRRSRRIVG
jgi:hypothetical protein